MDDMNAEGEEDGKARFVWLGLPKNPGHRDPVLKALILIGADRLESECNSEERDKALRDQRLTAMASLLSHKSTTMKPFRTDPNAMKQAPFGKPPAGGLNFESLSETDRNQVEEMLSRTFMAWADQEIPALNGKTPRQMIRTNAGKERIATMINEWENMSGHMQGAGIFKFDFNKLRMELQIPLE